MTVMVWHVHAFKKYSQLSPNSNNNTLNSGFCFYIHLKVSFKIIYCSADNVAI